MIASRIFIAVSLLGMAACDGFFHGPIYCDVSDPSSLAEPGMHTLTVFPTAITVVVGGTAEFQVKNATIGIPVDWWVEERAGGTIVEGHYRAPDKPGVFHVIVKPAIFNSGSHPCLEASQIQRAAPQVDSQLARATVTVEGPNFHIQPAWAEVATQSTTRFKAVSNFEEKGPVIWYLSEGTGGTVHSPDEDDLIFKSNLNTGTFHIRAVLEDHPDMDAHLAVTVTTSPAPVTHP